MAVREQRAINQGFNDVANQGRFLLNNFVFERMQRDGIENAPALLQLQEQDRGPPLEHVREIGRVLRLYGDDLDRDQGFAELVSRVPADAEQQTLMNVAGSIFQDGVFNWGRVVALFYFAYKICLRAVNRIELIRNIINSIVVFMNRYVVQWILDHGGWEAIVEHWNSSKKKLGLFIVGGLTVCAGAFLYNRFWS
ncbi:hypothetical protein BsWGS_19313 [Bradybaena similaris]